MKEEDGTKYIIEYGLYRGNKLRNIDCDKNLEDALRSLYKAFKEVEIKENHLFFVTKISGGKSEHSVFNIDDKAYLKT